MTDTDTMDRRAEQRRKNFNLNFGDQPIRKREEQQLQIRKANRDAHLAKRRTAAVQDGQTGAASVLSRGQLDSGESMASMVAGVRSSEVDKQLEATQRFRQLLSIEETPPIQDVIDLQVIPHFVEFLTRDDQPKLQFEAAWALTNIASGTQLQTREVVRHNAIPLFVKLLGSPAEDVREQAVWALGNIAGDNTGCRDQVLAAGALPHLLNLLRVEEQNHSMLRNGTWTLSNLCRGKPQPRFDLVAPALATLATLVHCQDVEVLTDACWALSYLSDGPNERIDAVLKSGVTRRLVDLLLHQSPMVQTPALRTIGNIVTGDDRQTDTVIQHGCIQNLHSLLSSTKKGIRKEACWTISNITAGNRLQIDEVIRHGLIPPLVALLTEGEFDIQKEAAWALSNAASGGNGRQVEYLVTCGLIKPLLTLLDVNDTKVILVALEALENILLTGKQKQKDEEADENPYCAQIEVEGGLLVLEHLQENADEDIYQKAIRIILTYFPFEEDVDHQPPSNLTFGAEAPKDGFNFQ